METPGCTKRKRTPNFSLEEKLRFVRLLREHGLAIISKVTSHDASTNKEKENTWRKITLLHNSSGNIMRTTDTLKKMWGKLKSEAKTFKAGRRLAVTGTGGGPSVKFEDPVLELVAEITGRGSTGVLNIEDSDALEPKASTSKVEADPLSGNGSVIEDSNDIEYLDESILEVENLPDEVIFIEEKEEIESQSRYKKDSKRRQPNISDNERSEINKKRSQCYNKFTLQKIKAEEEKLKLIKQQQEQSSELHKIKIENENLKNQLLKTIIKNISDADSKDLAKEAAKIIFKDGYLP